MVSLTVDGTPVEVPLISLSQNAATPTPAMQDLSGLRSDDDLMLMACDLPQLPAPTNPSLHPQLLPGDGGELWGFGSLSTHEQQPATGKQAGY